MSAEVRLLGSMPPPPPASPPPIDMGGARRPALGTLAAGIGRVSGLAPMQLLRPAERPIGPGAAGVAMRRDALEVCVRRRPHGTTPPCPPPWPPPWPLPARAKTSSSRWLCMLSRWLCMRKATPEEPHGALPAPPAPPAPPALPALPAVGAGAAGARRVLAPSMEPMSVDTSGMVPRVLSERGALV